MEQASAGRPVGVEVTFEVYVSKAGRWLIRDVLEEREAALELARQLAAQKEFGGVKVVREQVDLRTRQSTERTIFDTAFPALQPVPATPRPVPEAEPAPVRPAPARAEPPPTRAEPRRADRGSPWLMLISALLGLTFAAVGFWFISAIR